MVLAFDFNPRPALVHIEQLAQIGMPMGADLPIMNAAAQRNGFAVQQVRAEPVLLLAVEFEHRDGGGCHGLNLMIKHRGDNRTD